MVKRQKLSNNLIPSIARRKWYDVYQYLNEANKPDSTNSYALHIACSDRATPLKIVIDIYFAYPKAVLTKNSYQDTPVFIAVDVGFEDAVHFLVNTCPEASKICDANGETPIHLAVYGLNSNRMIDFIITANPEAAFISDNKGDSAFDFFFHQWNVPLRIALSNHTENSVLNNATGHGDWNILDIYQKTCLFLKAANLCRRGEVLDDTCLLHCALQESCHWAFCKLLMMLHPNSILQRDLNGNLPIHIITACGDTSDEKTFLCLDCFEIKNDLVYVELVNGRDLYCCLDCLQHETYGKVMRSCRIRPGK